MDKKQIEQTFFEQIKHITQKTLANPINRKSKGDIFGLEWVDNE